LSVTQHNYYQAGEPCFIANGTAILFSAFGDYPDNRTYLFTVPTDGTQPPKRLAPPRKSQTRGGTWGSQPSVSLDGKRIAFISDRGETAHYDVLTMCPHGTETRPLGVTHISQYNQRPVFHPDGKGIVFLAGTDWNAYSRPIFSLWQVDVDGSNPRLVAESGLFTDPMHFGPGPPPATKTP
jgi:Tol biopolymer transport system component